MVGEHKIPDRPLDCGYLERSQHCRLMEEYQEIGRMLHGLYDRWKTYAKADESESVEDD